MKKVIKIIEIMKVIKRRGMFVIMAVLLCGCGQKDAVNHSFALDSEYVMDKGILVVGVTDFEPLDYLQEEKWIGFDAEMAGLFAESLGCSVQFVEIDWNKRLVLLNNGTIDCIWNGMTLSEQVRQDMECSIAYLNNAQMIVVPVENAEKLRTAEDCMHVLFAVETGSAGEKELRERKYRFRAVGSQMEALENVVSGEADAAVIDLIMAEALLGEGKQFAGLVCTDAMSSEEYGIGFRKGSDLAEMADDFLRENYQNGTLYETAGKYGVQEAVIER